MNPSNLAYVNKLKQQLQNRVDPERVGVLQEFAQLLWARAVEEDLAQRSVSDDAGATIEAFRILNDADPAQVGIHLLNPYRGRDGWQSNFSVVIVTAPNMPFMVDSVLMALSHDGLVTHHLNNVVMGVDRDSSGTILGIANDVQHQNRELLIYAEIDRLDDAAFEPLYLRLTNAASELSAAVVDFPAMKELLDELVTGLVSSPPPLDKREVDEAIAFLQWLKADHFTFLGSRKFEYVDGVIRQASRAYGVQRVRPPASERLLADQPMRTQQFLMSAQLLSFSKSGTKSRVHRPAYPDYVGIKHFDENGQVMGETGFLGLYTSRAYMEFPERIPVVRHKVANVLRRSNLDPNGFDGKVLNQVLVTYPRDELFQISEDELLETAMMITDIHERRRVRVFTRYDAYGLFVNALVYMPRDLFSTSIRLALDELLTTTFNAEDSDYDILLSESILVRVQFTLRIRPGHQLDVNRIELERDISQLIGDWVTELHGALTTRMGVQEGRLTYGEYAEAFSAGYRERFEALAAVDDIAVLESLSEALPLDTRLYRLPEDPASTIRLKIFHLGKALPLSEVVPKLENLSLRVLSEHPFSVVRQTKGSVSIQDYELEFAGQLDLRHAGDELGQTFRQVWSGELEDDSFNKLVLTAELGWRQVRILRTYAQYMKQIKFGFSQHFISEVLCQHTAIAQALVSYFEARFKPEASGAVHGEEIRSQILTLLDAVALLNEDRILRKFLQLIDATKRTNFFVGSEGEAWRTYISIKLKPPEIPNMPQPVPAYEVFVSAPSFEGVHLRAGAIARGGLRWSDRLEDYRTEVLGLVKAQVVKNAVIVPSGAKGGFVVKNNRDGALCYQDFIRGLLDVTDNIANGEVVPPSNVCALDEADPYLVVAADKGTATFSDLANTVAAEYDFWLGDAFASGGTFGYDHKKMGITARGAWVSVQRHFAEREIDVQSDPVTVLGIGDMGGDVFGNGMLLSNSILLVAAFNHQHIFLDPDPEASSSFAERQRLFGSPRSSWQDYDQALLSPGGGIYERSVKSIVIHPRIKQRFDIDEDELAPDELINRLLRSPVQLIWNGGIGTYVKASHEDHGQVGDRSNDHLRVDADQLRCAVIAEGGNLGLTQAARVEYCLQGGAMNTDFIDNSAGVDCSDHEVNIKILVNDLVAREDITRKNRNQLLASLTDEVADLVLANNYRQAQSISLAVHFQLTQKSRFQRLLSFLHQHAGLDFRLEVLPSDEVLAERFSADQGFTRPELAVLLAYSKMHIKTQLIASDVRLGPLVEKRLLDGFPRLLREEYAHEIGEHRLAKEIVATQMANETVDYMGMNFVANLMEATGASVADIVQAYALVVECYELDRWFNVIRRQSALAESHRLQLLGEIAQLGMRATRWILRNCDLQNSADDLVSEFKSTIALIPASENPAVQLLPWRETIKQAMLDANISAPYALCVDNPDDLFRLLPIAEVVRQTRCDPQQLLAINSVVGQELKIDWFIKQLVNINPQSHWQSLQIDSLIDDISQYQSLVSSWVLKNGEGQFDVWAKNNVVLLEPWRAVMEEIRASMQTDLALYALAVRRMEAVCAKLH